MANTVLPSVFLHTAPVILQSYFFDNFSPAGRAGRSTGMIVNLVSPDCESLQLVCQNLHILWSSPLRIVVCIVLLYQELGPSSFVALAVLLLMIPVQKFIVGAVGKLLMKSLKVSSNRLIISMYNCIRRLHMSLMCAIFVSLSSLMNG